MPPKRPRELGGYVPVSTGRQGAQGLVSMVIPFVREIECAGATSLRDIAKALNARGITSPHGSPWHATVGAQLLARSSSEGRKR
jgi:hypothetical protein